MVFSCWLLRPMFEMLKSGSNQNQQQQPWRVNVQKNNSKLVQIQQQSTTTTTTTEIIISTPTLEKYNNNKKSFIYVRAKHSPWRSEQDRHSDTRSDGRTDTRHRHAVRQCKLIAIQSKHFVKATHKAQCWQNTNFFGWRTQSPYRQTDRQCFRDN